MGQVEEIVIENGLTFEQIEAIAESTEDKIPQ
jgi:hypothetical protein